MTAVPAPSRAPYPYLDFLPTYSPQLVDTATRNLLDIYAQAERYLNAQWNAIVDNPLGGHARARVQELLGSLERSRAHVDASVQEWIRTMYPGYYAGGATHMTARYDSPGFQWAQPHRDAVGLLAVDTYDSLLRATQYEPDTIKATVRELARQTAAETLVGSQTATQAGKSLAEKLRGQGIFNVTYADGKVVSSTTYANMVMRARTAIAYNAGGINQGRADGVEYFEISDGPDCGLAFHDDDTLANGLLVDGDVAATYPISHPNCVRDFLPRPDVTQVDVEGGDVSSAIDAQSASDQEAFDLFLRQEGATSGLTLNQAANKFRRLERQGRSPRLERAPRESRALRSLPSAGPAAPLVDSGMVQLARANIAEAALLEPHVTGAMVDAATNAGGEMAGLEFRIKTEESLLRKLPEVMSEEGVDLPTAAASIHDNLRYTTLFDGPAYAAGVRAQIRQLEIGGYRVVRVRNTWAPGSPYRGINVRMATPDGYLFELQFHTPSSWALKNDQTMHDVYASIKGLPVGDPAYEAAMRFMVNQASTLAMPTGAIGALPTGYVTGE